MKEAELRQHAVCSACGHKIGEAGLPLFWSVKAQRFGVDLNACKRHDGLAALIGSTAIAAVMGPDEDLAKPIGDAVTLTICDACACTKTAPLMVLVEDAR